MKRDCSNCKTDKYVRVLSKKRESVFENNNYFYVNEKDYEEGTIVCLLCGECWKQKKEK
jgi:hypothetical protein